MTTNEVIIDCDTDYVDAIYYGFQAKIYNTVTCFNGWELMDYTELNDFMIKSEVLKKLELIQKYQIDLLTENLQYFDDGDSKNFELKKIQIFHFNLELIRSHRNYITLTDILIRIKGE